MSGSFESMQWNACVRRPKLYSHPREFLGNGVGNHVNSEGKIPSTDFMCVRSVLCVLYVVFACLF